VYFYDKKINKENGQTFIIQGKQKLYFGALCAVSADNFS